MPCSSQFIQEASENSLFKGTNDQLNDAGINQDESIVGITVI